MTTTTTKAGGKSKAHEPVVKLVRDLVLRYTKHPEALQVDGGEMGPAIVMAVKAHRDDHPRLVGSQGRNISALQAVARAYGARHGRQIRLTLLEPTIGEKMAREEFREDPQWQPDATLKLLKRLIGETHEGKAKVRHNAVASLSYFMVAADTPITTELLAALNTLFHAIGRNEGRLIEVHADGSQGD